MKQARLYTIGRLLHPMNVILPNLPVKEIMKLYLEEERKVVNHYLGEKERGLPSNGDLDMEENNRGTEELEDTCVIDESDEVTRESHVGAVDTNISREKLLPQSHAQYSKAIRSTCSTKVFSSLCCFFSESKKRKLEDITDDAANKL
jgi:hypothetical protein